MTDTDIFIFDDTISCKECHFPMLCLKDKSVYIYTYTSSKKSI